MKKRVQHCFHERLTQFFFEYSNLLTCFASLTAKTKMRKYNIAKKHILVPIPLVKLLKIVMFPLNNLTHK